MLSNPIPNLRPSRRLLRIAIQSPKQGFPLSAYGQSSEARVFQALAGKAGQAVTTEAEITNILSGNGAFSTAATKRFIRLADTIEGPHTICPIVYLDGDFSKKHPYLRVQLIVVAHTAQPGDTPQCLLMRFETPEGEDAAGNGKHDYYHSQLCTELRIDRSPASFSIPERIMWGAVSCPAWPIDASTPFQLLACVVFSLYGKLDGMRILRKAYGARLDSLIEDMHFVFPVMKTAARRRSRIKSSRKQR